MPNKNKKRSGTAGTTKHEAKSSQSWTGDKDAWLYRNVNRAGGEIHLIDTDDLNDPDNNNDVTDLGDFKTIGSYNWAPESKPHRPLIVIPGRPSTLGNIGRLEQLKMKGYNQFVDENRYRQPNYPLESLFRAVQVCSPEFNFATDIDIVSDRNNLRKLANFAVGKQKEKFRIDIQKVGNVVLFVRNEKKPRMFSQDYGKDFEVKYTTNEREEGSHRRIVSYTLGSIRLAVRFEVDCAEMGGDQASSDKTVDTLASELSQINISLVPDQPKPFGSSSKLAYLSDGQLDKAASLVELTTTKLNGSAKRHPKNKINQMLFSKTQNLVIGWHKEGALRQIDKLTWQELCDKCSTHSQDIQVTLTRLSRLLGKLIEIATRESGGATLSLIHTKDNTGRYVLKVFKSLEEKPNLPNDLIEYLKTPSQS